MARSMNSRTWRWRAVSVVMVDSLEVGDRKGRGLTAEHPFGKDGRTRTLVRRTPARQTYVSRTAVRSQASPFTRAGPLESRRPNQHRAEGSASDEAHRADVLGHRRPNQNCHTPSGE